MDTADYSIHVSSYVDQPCEIGSGTHIWHFCHIMRHCTIGRNCNLGQNVVISPDVRIGNKVKIQNNVSVYTGTIIEDDVFLGPSCVLTNVTNPRSEVNRRTLYEPIIIRRGATVGANATVVCGVRLGRYCFIGAGAVVTKDVPDYGLWLGNPARHTGWISRHGHRLITPDAEGLYICPESGFRYREIAPGILRCLDLDEEAELPPSLAVGTRTYDELKAVTFSS